jgi:hypothetical protein
VKKGEGDRGDQRVRAERTVSRVVGRTDGYEIAGAGGRVPQPRTVTHGTGAQSSENKTSQDQGGSRPVGHVSLVGRR